MLVVAAACAPLPSGTAAPEPGAGALDARSPVFDAAAWAASVPRVDEAASADAHAGARTYSGALSCADCPERRLTLTIFADGTFRMRQAGAGGAGKSAEARPKTAAAAGSGTGGGPVVHRMGRWAVSPEAADTLALYGDGEGATLLRRVVPDGLVIVDHEGREIRGFDNATLWREARVDPLIGPLRLAGRYRHEGARPVFVECLTGRRMPVVAGTPASGSAQAARLLSAARSALDGAYRAVSLAPDDPVLAIVHGYLVPRVAQPASPEKEALVVAAFERAMRDGRCEDVVRKSR